MRNITASLTAVPSNDPPCPQAKRCNSCECDRPIDEFRRRSQHTNVRANQCRLCHNQAERLRRQRKRGWINKRLFHQYLTSLKNQRTTRGVERVYLDLCQKFGGTAGLIQMWSQTMAKDMAEGGFKAYRHIASILRLMEYWEDTQPDKPDYSQMSDEELIDRWNNLTADD